MRTIKELLQLMLDNQQYFQAGLCYWSNNLYANGLINMREWVLLKKYIKVNRPSAFSSINALMHRNSAYFWEPENIKYRVQWLEKHIKLN
jgi:hypothetical protein